MQEIARLGDDIEHAWAAAGYCSEYFPVLAQAALEARALPESLSVDRLIRWFALSPQIPHQPPNARFGEPPIQLYAGRRFYIEALSWTDGTTAIHQHSFSGAFQVVLGGSIHTTYRFERTEAIGPDLVLGNLQTERSELLGAGAVRPIVSGDHFVHSLFHLERPSMTLVVRTRHDTGTDPQYSYLHPGIAFDPFPPDERSSRLLQLVDALDAQSSQTTELLADLAAHADLGTVVAMLMHWFRLRPADPAACEALLAVVAFRHCALANHLRGALQEARRQALIFHRRRSNHRADHRFFLALLINVGDRARILQFVEQQYPGHDPIELILTWIEDLLAAQTTGSPDAPGATSGEYDLGEAELTVLHHLLRQRTPEQIIAALGEKYNDVESQRARILDLCGALTGSALLEPLFRVAP